MPSDPATLAVQSDPSIGAVAIDPPRRAVATPADECAQPVQMYLTVESHSSPLECCGSLLCALSSNTSAKCLFDGSCRCARKPVEQRVT
eukprot:4989729-Amphidinium_carterae.2